MAAKTLTFDFYTDPGHGWVKVKLSLIKQLGIKSKISTYSYVRGKYVYLEEDCDAGELFKALQDRSIEVKWRDHHSDKRSKIRGYHGYNAAANINWDTCELS